VLKLADVVLTVKLGEGCSPLTISDCPEGTTKNSFWRLAREEFLEALRRVSIIASDKTWGISPVA